MRSVRPLERLGVASGALSAERWSAGVLLDLEMLGTEKAHLEMAVGVVTCSPTRHPGARVQGRGETPWSCVVPLVRFALDDLHRVSEEDVHVAWPCARVGAVEVNQ